MQYSSPSLKFNLISNYISQLYITVIGVLSVPIYVRYMGVEAYGLVGFFGMLQTWFQLLDLGLTPTLAREVSRFRGGVITATSLRQLLSVLEKIFILIAFVGTGLICLSSEFITHRWLKVERLPLQEVHMSVIIMAIIIALRWISGLYKSVVSGFENLVWLSIFNSVIGTVRFFGVIPFFIYVSNRPSRFFIYQGAIALIEVIGLIVQTRFILPSVSQSQLESKPNSVFSGILSFSLSMMLATIGWQITIQTDKLLLSTMLSLTEYSYFSMAVVAASGVLIIAGPVSAPLIPRITKLFAEKNYSAINALYFKATEFLAVIVIPTSLTLAIYSPRILFAWTGNQFLAQKAAPILTLYALGNCIQVFCGFPYYLQYAMGNLKLHLIGMSFFMTVLIAFLWYGSHRFGMLGAGYAWLAANALSFLFWVYHVHNRLIQGMHFRWVKSIAVVLFPVALLGYFINVIIVWPDNRILQGTLSVTIGSIMLVCASIASPITRAYIFQNLQLLVKKYANW